MIEEPTLKIRCAPKAALGRSCLDVAAEVVVPGIAILDAKWGRTPGAWRETGGGWGRPALDSYDRGFIDALALANDDEATRRLVDIVRKLTGYPAEVAS